MEHASAREWSVARDPVERFIKDNDAKRQRALKKERDEVAERLELQQEVDALELSERRTRMSLLELMDTLRRLAKYEEFLEGEDQAQSTQHVFGKKRRRLRASGANPLAPPPPPPSCGPKKKMSSCGMNLSRVRCKSQN